MSKKTRPSKTTHKRLTSTRKASHTNVSPSLKPSDPASISQALPQEQKDILDERAVNFALYQNDLTKFEPQPVRWLWPHRLPLSGITLLDGDHGLGKSLLALEIAARVSSGIPMPDGTPTIQGGVVIVSPYADATTTQLPLLTRLGADLSRIEILSFIQETVPSDNTSNYRPFSLPEDFSHLFAAIERVDARLVIFDPFISLLSRGNRWTDTRLSHLLSDLNQRLIERNVACLLLRNCPAKGGHARPSVLERSDHFVTIAVSVG